MHNFAPVAVVLARAALITDALRATKRFALAVSSLARSCVCTHAWDASPLDMAVIEGQRIVNYRCRKCPATAWLHYRSDVFVLEGSL